MPVPKIDWQPIETAPKNKFVLVAVRTQQQNTSWYYFVAELPDRSAFPSFSYWTGPAGVHLSSKPEYWSELPNEPGQEEPKAEWVETPESSNISGFGYDPVTKDLTVRFGQTNEYVYHGVPPGAFECMKKAESKGKYLGSDIKGIYPYSRRDIPSDKKK